MTAPTFPMFVSVEDARHLLARLLPVKGEETVPLAAALGRTLAQDVAALVSHPSATESALDGIACREADTLAAPVTLQVVGESRAGQPFGAQVQTGECIRIYTGAPLCPGTDAICPIEQLADVDAHHVRLLRPASRGDVRPEGGDFHTGEVVLKAGLPLTPSRLALVAALGHAEVQVKARLSVALLSTGDEVVAPGTPLQPGQVYDSNSVGLSALLQECGCEVVALGHAPDRPDALKAMLREAGGADLLLTSGGVSMGRYDFMRDLLVEHGEVEFWKIRMRPGGPAILGRWNGLPVFGLPGNPVSSLVVFQVIVKPALTGQPLRTLRLKAGTPFKALPDKTAFWRATVLNGEVHEYARQGSGVLRSLSDADALVIVPEGQAVQAGESVEALLL
ncbi:gephyrin-like molybdotransferase Glp [Deinococcus fonticola]|uniref:molybdopterin molybdotransferase MoeA n=1 Tax=Deinococcus fonticola TaxID=2528713 RepID=UPI0010750673|nr:gephyrin-like molybdotransferase Glp [Deinococcus fonticola]